MPKYSYRCQVCELEFETRHSIKDKLYDCKSCGNEQSLLRIPQLTNIVKKHEKQQNKTGSLVREYIEENKKILKEQKKERIEYDN